MSFDITIDGTNEPIAEGETLEVDYTVTNSGSSTDTQPIELYLDEDTSSSSGADYYEPFDDTSFWNHLEEGYEINQSLVSSPARSGQALQVEVLEGNNQGTNMFWHPQDHVGTRPDQMHVRYWVYPDENFDVDHQYKFPSIGYRDQHGWGGRGADGTSGWTARIALDDEHSNHPDDIHMEYYIYHADVGVDNYGEHFDFPSDVGISRGQWNQIDFFVDVGTAGSYDSVVRTWIDGTLAHEVTDLMFRQSGYESQTIDEYWFNYYHGGNQTAPTDLYLTVDDLSIWCDQGQQL